MIIGILLLAKVQAISGGSDTFRLQAVGKENNASFLQSDETAGVHVEEMDQGDVLAVLDSGLPPGVAAVGPTVYGLLQVDGSALVDSDAPSNSVSLGPVSKDLLQTDEIDVSLLLDAEGPPGAIILQPIIRDSTKPPPK